MKYPVLTNGNGSYEVEKHPKGTWRIITKSGWTKSTALYLDNGVCLWEPLDSFTSGIRAYAFMKQNLDNLI